MSEQYRECLAYLHQRPGAPIRFFDNRISFPIWQGTFLPYGQEWNPQLTTNHYKFTGKERDAESGLDFFGARFYSSTMGRWMSPDWADKPEPVPYADLSDPQSLDLYSYVRNNPMSKADADGHCEVDGEHHRGSCLWHKLGFYQTKVDKVNEARNFYAHNAIYDQHGHKINPSKLSDDQILQAFTDLNRQVQQNVLLYGFAFNYAHGLEVHHELPTQFEAEFRAVGLNIEDDDFKVILEFQEHRAAGTGIHAGNFEQSWNGQWEQFFKTFKQQGTAPTKAQVLEQLNKLRTQFGIW